MVKNGEIGMGRGPGRDHTENHMRISNAIQGYLRYTAVPGAPSDAGFGRSGRLNRARGPWVTFEKFIQTLHQHQT